MNDGDPSEKHPVVFVSYSHDSLLHKEWVEALATRLRGEGVANVILDVWDTEHGDDLPKFMERSVRNADRVLMICSAAYVSKANEGKGGAGYETMIVTGELIADQGKAKFIPVIPHGNVMADVPTCLGTKKYVDFRNVENFAQTFDELVESIHHLTGGKKPSLGLAERFRKKKGVAASSRTAEIVDVNRLKNPMDFHRRATEIIDKNDVPAWRSFVKDTRMICVAGMREIRQKYEGISSISPTDETGKIILEAALVYAPMFVVALAGIESRNDKFNNQTDIISDILNPSGWNPEGHIILEELPKSLAFLYQAINGAMCMHSRQFDLAVKMGRFPLVLGPKFTSGPLFKN